MVVLVKNTFIPDKPLMVHRGKVVRCPDKFFFFLDRFVSSSEQSWRNLVPHHQWILCSEWVPSEWESKQLIKTSQYSTSNPLYSSQSVNVGLLVDYCDVFTSCLDSHSDGTHSLQIWWRNKLIYILDGLNGTTFIFQYIFIFGWTVPLSVFVKPRMWC